MVRGIIKKVGGYRRRTVVSKFNDTRKNQNTTMLKAKIYQGTFDRFARTVFAVCDHYAGKEKPTRADSESLKQLANLTMMATTNLMRKFDTQRSVQGARSLAPSHIDGIFRTDPSLLTLISVPEPVRV